MLYELTYINERGESVSFKGSQYNFREPGGQKDHLSNPFSLIKFEGFGEVGADVQLQKAPFQDGSTHLDTVLQERTPYLEFVIVADNWNSLSKYRKRVSSVFNPKINGRFELSFDNKTYVLESIPESVPFFADEDTVGRSQVVSVNFICPNPYWKSASTTNEQLVTFSGGMTFPLRLPTIFGNQVTDAKSRIIVNEGDVPTPIEVTFEGPATSPIRIENETTGEFIEVEQDLLEGEKLWICTEFGRKRVEKILADGTRQNAFHYIYIDPTGVNPSSTFFQLQPGNNLLTYDTGEEYEKAPVTVRFNNRYVGI
jgi:Phage tail protein